MNVSQYLNMYCRFSMESIKCRPKTAASPRHDIPWEASRPPSARAAPIGGQRIAPEAAPKANRCVGKA